MILPIVAYGDPVLKKKAQDITKDYDGLQELIANMFETMYNASGVGIAAPQIGRSIRIFVVDPSPFAEDDDLDEAEQEVLKKSKKVFINAKITDRQGEEWGFMEGCLSIPGIHEDVFRPEEITIDYYDENFEHHIETIDGLLARVIQHEYDHIEGILFTDKLSSLKKRLINNKLKNIAKGDINIDYRMRFPKAKKTR